MHRRSAIAAVLGGTFSHALPSWAQGSYPAKPVRVIVPSAAGGINDVLARALAIELGSQLKQPIVIENRAGANFGLGFQAVKAAPPDGYTLLWLSGGPLSIYPHLYKDLPYRTEDFQLITTVMRGHQVLAVRKDSKTPTLQSYIEAARSSQQPALVGVASIGGGPHLMMEMLGQNAKFNVQPVVYKGEGPAVLDLLAGTVPAVSVVTPSVFKYYQAGEVRILAVSADKRVAGMPDVPTFKEAGIADMVVRYTQGLAAPAGTPAAVIDVLHRAIVASADSSGFRGRLLPDMEVTTMSPAEYLKMINDDSKTWGTLIRKRNIVVEQ